MNDLTAAALDYIERGLRVIALTGKAPNGRVHPHGLKDYLSLDNVDLQYPRECERMFAHSSTSGVGILTSYPLVVVDIDGEDGARAWRDLVGPDEFIPDRWVAKTGRGLHLYMGTTSPVGSMQLAPLLDLKGEGGYVAAPPSRHPDGHLYEWLLAPAGALMEVPGALADVFARRAREAEAWVQERREYKAQSERSLSDGKLYAVATFDGIIRHIAEAEEGNRNRALYWAARTMAEEGADPEDMEELLDAAIRAGLGRTESRRSIRSALTATHG